MDKRGEPYKPFHERNVGNGVAFMCVENGENERKDGYGALQLCVAKFRNCGLKTGVSMKKSEKIIAAVLIMIISVLLITLKGKFIGVVATVAGVSLIVLGIVDIFGVGIPPAVVKIVVGLLIVICGFALVRAVVYVVAALLLIVGILLLYDKLKNGTHCIETAQKICEIALPSICILIGVLLLFHNVKMMNTILIVCGLLSLLEGGLVLFSAFGEDG